MIVKLAAPSKPESFLACWTASPFAAAAQINGQKQIRELRQRIKQLETQPLKPLV